MSRYSRPHRSRTRAVVVIDGNALNIEHVYVNCSLREAMHMFMQTLRSSIDISYDDLRDELKDALNRYQFIETTDVSIRRQ